MLVVAPMCVCCGLALDDMCTVRFAEQEEMGENMFLTPAQREWVKQQEALLYVKPQKKVRRPGVATSALCVTADTFAAGAAGTHTHTQNKPPLRGTCYSLLFDLVESPSFDAFIMLCILGNTGVMAMMFFGQVRPRCDPPWHC